MRRLFFNSAALGSSSLVSQVFTALAFWLVARSLGPGEFGVFAGFYGLALLVHTSADFGMNSHAIRALAHDPGNIAAYEETLASKLLLALILTSAWVVMFLAGEATQSGSAAYAVLGGYVGIVIVVRTLEIPFRAGQNMNLVAIATVIERGAFLAITAGLLVTGELDSLTASVALAIAPGVSVLYLFRAGSQLGISANIRIGNFRSLRELWKTSLGFGASALATQLQRLDVLIVTAVSGGFVAGVFAAPARLTGPLGMIPTAFSSALFPHIAASQDRPISRRQVNLAIAAMLLVTACGLVILFVLADAIVPVALGDDYVGAVSVLRIYLIGMVAASLNQPLAIVLQAKHRERYVAKVTAVSSVAGLSGIGIGAYLGDAQGAAFGFLLLQFLNALALGWGYLQLDSADRQIPAQLAEAA